tara:strand:+ start:792 stop:968 length:177 start_codon:yes stop_codon:yes gene_type:complete
MIDIPQLKSTIDKMAMITGMLTLLAEEPLNEKANKMKNSLIDTLIQEIVVLNKILEKR